MRYNCNTKQQFFFVRFKYYYNMKYPTDQRIIKLINHSNYNIMCNYAHYNIDLSNYSFIPNLIQCYWYSNYNLESRNKYLNLMTSGFWYNLLILGIHISCLINIHNNLLEHKLNHISIHLFMYNNKIQELQKNLY